MHITRAKIAVKACVFAAFLASSAGNIFAKDAAGAQSSDAAEHRKNLEVARQLNDAFIQVADDVSPAVVVITVTQKPGAEDEEAAPFLEMLPPEWRKRFQDKKKGSPRSSPHAPRATGRGSGVVITEDGYILTNNHVVENAEKIRVRFKDSREFDAEVRGVDSRSDLAVIKIKGEGLLPVKFADSSKTRVGEFVIAIGAPFDLDYSVTFGHVSAKGRSFERMSPDPVYLDQDFIQTDASINPGNSGGPLVNLYGEVIGINAMIRGLNTGIGFAIPSNLAKVVVDHLIKDGRFTRSYLGIVIRGLREYQEFKSLVPNLEDGVVIYEIAPNGPAAKSDLKPSDIVVGVDGKPVKTPRELKEEIASKPVGQNVALDVVRDGKKITVKVKTAALPEEDDGNNSDGKKASPAEPTSYGLTVEPLTKESSEKYGVEATAGVVVSAVEPDSPADQRQIKPGDVITEVNRKSVGNLKEFRKLIKESDPKKGVIVNLISNGTGRFVILKESGD
jgi:serine protease Do